MADEKKYIDGDGLTNVLTKLKSVTDEFDKELHYGFGTASFEDFVSIIEAADNGEIDLYEDLGWRVGDEREIFIPAYSTRYSYVGTSTRVDYYLTNGKATLVLMDRGEGQTFELRDTKKYKDGTDRIVPSFIVGVKDVLNTTSSPLSYSTGSPYKYITYGGQNFVDAVIGSLINNVSSDYNKIFKVFKYKVVQHPNSNTMVTTVARATLPAVMEVFGSNPGGYAMSIETSTLKQLEYYKTASNRLKYEQVSSSSTIYYAPTGYMTRSSVNYPSGSLGICQVTANDSVEQQTNASTSGNLKLSPIMAI